MLNKELKKTGDELRSLSQSELHKLIEKNEKIYTEHFDKYFSINLVKNIIQNISDCYFRSRFIGFENLPKRNDPDRPLIYISNHSGMAFPWDAMIFAAMLFKRNNYQFQDSVRALASPMLSETTLMNPYMIQNFWKRAGGIDASSLNFETMMHYKHSDILMYPEGVPGIGKGFNNKYKLQRFATSIIRMSLKYRTDLIPVATVNGEYINPHAYKSEIVNSIANKIGIPFIPVGIMTLLIPFQPWIFYFGFPAKLTYVLGERLKPYEWMDKPYEELTEENIQFITESARKRMQTQLNAAVKKYGKHPYNHKEIFSIVRKNIKKYPFFLPFLWPLIFTDYERLVNEHQAEKFELNFIYLLKIFRNNPIVICYYLPIIGWIPLLIRGLKNRIRNK